MGLVVLSEELIVASVVALLGGGLLGGFASVWKARQESKRSPADINSVSISSAERALIMLKTLLDEAEEDIIELRRERDEERERHRIESRVKDEKIRELEQNLRHLEGMFNEVSDKLLQVLRTAQEARSITEEGP